MKDKELLEYNRRYANGLDTFVRLENALDDLIYNPAPKNYTRACLMLRRFYEDYTSKSMGTFMTAVPDSVQTPKK